MSQQATGNSICMYTPSADGGHALYTRELLRALVSLEEGARGERQGAREFASPSPLAPCPSTPLSNAGHRFQFELVTSENLAAEFRANEYPVHHILPALALPESFS